MTLSYFVAIPFIRANDGAIMPGEAIECPNAAIAVLQAEALSQRTGNVGAIAFSRTADDVGIFSEAVILTKLGDVPSDLTMLF